MATAGKTRKTKNRESAPLTEAEITADVILRDIRFIKIIGERFIPPEMAPKGGYILNPLNYSFTPAPSENSKFGVASYSCLVTGLQAIDPNAPKNSEREKCFTLELHVEGLLNVVGGGTTLVSEEEVKRLANVILRQMHVFLTTRIRSIANDFGYVSVRPALGLPNDPAKYFDIE